MGAAGFIAQAHVDTVLKTGNVMLDAILNSKLTLIKEKKIAVDATAIVPQNIEISGIELSALIGNLLDNAMEACMRILILSKSNYIFP